MESFEAAEYPKLVGFETHASTGLSGVTPGNREGLTFRRVRRDAIHA